MKKFNNSSEINYVTVGEESYQVPGAFHAKVPASYEMRSSRKGFQRYWIPEIKELLRDFPAEEQQRELTLQGILQGSCETIVWKLSEVAVSNQVSCRARRADKLTRSK